jgi:hypothetical protein
VLHIGFVRMIGRPLNSVRAVPAVLLRHLGQLVVVASPARDQFELGTAEAEKGLQDRSDRGRHNP